MIYRVVHKDTGEAEEIHADRYDAANTWVTFWNDHRPTLSLRSVNLIEISELRK